MEFYYREVFRLQNYRNEKKKKYLKLFYASVFKAVTSNGTL